MYIVFWGKATAWALMTNGWMQRLTFPASRCDDDELLSYSPLVCPLAFLVVACGLLRLTRFQAEALIRRQFLAIIYQLQEKVAQNPPFRGSWSLAALLCPLSLVTTTVSCELLPPHQHGLALAN